MTVTVTMTMTMIPFRNSTSRRSKSDRNLIVWFFVCFCCFCWSTVVVHSFAPAALSTRTRINPARSSTCTYLHLLNIGGPWFKPNQSSKNQTSSSDSATFDKKKKSSRAAETTIVVDQEQWLMENLEIASKDMIESYHDEAMVLKAAIAEMMEKLESSNSANNSNNSTVAAVDSLMLQVEDQQAHMETLVVQATGDLIESMESVSQTFSKAQATNAAKQEALFSNVDDRLTAIQTALGKQTAAIQAQTSQRQLQFAIEQNSLSINAGGSNAFNKIAFVYQEHGQSKQSSVLVQEILFYFLRNFGMILPADAMIVERQAHQTQTAPGAGQRFGPTSTSSSNRGSNDDDDDNEGDDEQKAAAKQAFRDKLMEQLETLLGVEPSLQETEDGDFVVRLKQSQE
eukprot:CAMPEP_0198153784 /NCGR_PEP_ID=MMETSP1443-20131203/65731_1 /TAXON_ID=186043 /ORGANISM="Entomoneis sp., Strain CCMP2396" /LENGTH=398 /DNA_ID=CAMNT_0043820243 /DNA_START=34 /DNA_END=1230 /DNA_ORIENTATION=-